jgi:exodeoxyribonuclease VII large subunit
MGQSDFDFQPQRKIYSVSELSLEIRKQLERHFLDVWVTGEISNFRAATSGHLYFTLKDTNAQIRAVCFRNQARYLKFKPEDGLSVIARGRLSVYEMRGEYQLVLEFLEPAGLGALQLAFEQLKAKLGAEGLFDSARRKPLPLLPRTLGVVTSPTGAVINDISRILRRRFPNINVLLYPVRVQGEGATREIVNAIEHLNRRGEVDVIILARGGGSLEDLWAFNEESVARAIAASKTPLISAVGHETDFTIADFVADLRAPTPSAAAELVVRRKEDFEGEIENQIHRLSQLMRLRFVEAQQRLMELRMHRVFETIAARLAQRAQRVDEARVRLDRAVRKRLEEARHECVRASSGVLRYDMLRLLGWKRARTDEHTGRMEAEFRRYVAERRSLLSHVQAVLGERNPLVILNRGYSITRDASGRILRDANQVALENQIWVRLARGELGATVRERRRSSQDGT